MFSPAYAGAHGFESFLCAARETLIVVAALGCWLGKRSRRIGPQRSGPDQEGNEVCVRLNICPCGIERWPCIAPERVAQYDGSDIESKAKMIPLRFLPRSIR